MSLIQRRIARNTWVSSRFSIPSNHFWDTVLIELRSFHQDFPRKKVSDIPEEGASRWQGSFTFFFGTPSQTEKLNNEDVVDDLYMRILFPTVLCISGLL
jgi:hypothetical protein